jgi:hypothetical protein
MSLVDPHLVHAVFVYSFLSNKQDETITTAAALKLYVVQAWYMER